MDDVIRRGDEKRLPVQARRVVPATAGEPVPPQTIRVPAGAVTGAGDPNVPGGPHTVVYVTVPAGAAATPPPPGEVHYHTTTQVTNHHYAPTRRRRSRTTSFLGTLGLVVGGVACGAAYVPQVLPAAHYLSLAAVAMAAWAFVLAVLVRRTGAGMPLLGLLAGGAGYVLWLRAAGELPAAWDHLRARSPVSLPALPPAWVTPPSPVAPPTAVPTDANPSGRQTPPPQPQQSPGTPAPPVEPAKRPRSPNLFDPHGDGWVSPRDAKPGQKPSTVP